MKHGVSDAVSAKELKKREFIINGNLWKAVLYITLPLFVFSIFNYFYGIIDTIMCTGISKDAVNAVGALSQVTNMVSAIGTGLAAGGSILIAREIGRNDYKRAKQLSNTVFTYTIIIAALTCAIVIPLAAPILRILGVTEQSINVGLGYFIISVITTAVMMVNIVFMGVEKAKGSTLVITLLNIGVVLIKVGLNAMFLYGFNLKDMVYVSVATLIANLLLTAYIIVRLAMKSYVFHFSFGNIDFSGKTAGKITGISFPIFLGKFIFSLGKVVINGLAGSYGNDVVGALGISNNMGGSITNPLSSIEDSSSSIISQNLGANKPKRAINTFYIGLIFNVMVAVIGIIIISIFDTPITMFFARQAGSTEDQVVFAQQISRVFFYEKMGILALAINSSVLGMLYGFGFTRLSMIINIARVFVFRIPSFLVCRDLLHITDGYQAAGIAMGFSNISIGIVAIIVGIFVIIRVKRRERLKEESKMLSKETTDKLNIYINSYLATFTHYKDTNVWCYEDGVILLGSYYMYKATRQKEYLNFCISYFDKNIGEDGSLIGYDPKEANIDNLQAGTALFYVDSIHHEEKYTKALTLLFSQLQNQPRTKAGSMWHKKKYPDQVWLDGLYMGQPFYALEATKNNSLRMKKDIIHQFENVKKFNYDSSSGLYYHVYDETKSMLWADKKSGRSPNIWLRSVGWLVMASADVCEIFRQHHSPIAAKHIKWFLLTSLSSLEKYQDEKTHMYYDLPIIKNPDNYLEASGSLMIAYGYMKGARTGILDYSLMKEGTEIFEGVINTCFKDGRLNDICLVSGLDAKRDGSISYYLSEKRVSDDPKGVGPMMMAYAEYLSTSY